MADAAAFGAPPEILAQLRAAADDDDAVEIHHDNADAFVLFDALGSQWRTCAAGSDGAMMRTGLDYGVVESAARMLEIAAGADLFWRLRVLEAAAISEWADKMKHEARR